MLDDLRELQGEREAVTSAELLLLEAATARIEQRREVQLHDALRGRGRPDVSLQRFREGQLAAADGAAAAQLQLAVALSADVTRDERLEAARAAVLAFPRELEEYAGAAPKLRQRRLTRSTREVAEAVKLALESGIVGHRAARGDAGAYVQQEDLDDLVPDGWGRMFPLEVSRLGRRSGVAPLAVPLLCLLIWSSRLKPADPRDPRRCGAGAQFSLGWLAQKLGCSVSWTKVLLNRLDPHAEYRRELAAVRYENARRKRAGRVPRREPLRPRGTPYIHRFRRLQRYSATKQRDGGRALVWVDKSGKPHTWVDVRGVCYVTDAGRALLVRRASHELPKPGVVTRLRPNGALTDLEQRLRPIAWRLDARFGGGAFEAEAFEKSTSPPARAGVG